MHAPGDLRTDPKVLHPTAVIRLAATCVWGSDLWPYRGIEPVTPPIPMGHEYAGIVEETGSEVRNIKPDGFVVGSFFASDGTCEICQDGYQSRCAHLEFVGALVATHGNPDPALVPSLLAASDVRPGKTVARSGCSPCSPPGNSAPRGSSR
jgi:threonine dehydrogenase-like Zn-dependent dehydrogenase